MRPYPENAHWRDSARSVKFFIWDGRVTFPILLFLFYIHIWTFIVAIFAMIFFSLLIRYGFTPIVFFRWFRNLLSGSRKISLPWWHQ
jgi:intracellular multiplication protein IcmT